MSKTQNQPTKSNFVKKLTSFPKLASFITSVVSEGTVLQLKKKAGSNLREVVIESNSGTPFRYGSEDIIVDYSRSTAAQRIPILRDHDSSRILGHTTGHEDNRVFTGVLSGDPNEVAQITQLADNGYQWQSSIHLDTDGYEEYDSDHEEPIEVNGHEYKAPLVVVWGRIREVTITALGADENTSSTIFSWNPVMPDDLNDNADDALEVTAESDESTQESTSVEVPDSSETSEVQSTLKARMKVRKYINAIEAVGNKFGASDEDIETAVKERKTADQFELMLLRRDRNTNAPKGKGHAKDERGLSFEVLEAAAFKSLGVHEPPKGREQHWEMADKTYKYQGVGLQELLLEACRLNGHRGPEYRRYAGNERAVLKAAFSTHSLSGVLSNVQNTLLGQAFMAVEQEWRKIALITSSPNFHPQIRYALTGDFTFEQLGPSGEIKHGTWGEQSYTISMDTYAKMYSISRRDLINDDMGAFGRLTARLGRGAALKVNEVVWPTFMDNSTFFTLARGNYMEGAGTTLQASQLAAAELLIAAYTDPDGKPYPVNMDRLVVPKALEITARQLMSDTLLAEGTTAGALYSNPWRSRYQVVSSIYLSNSSYTGHSSTAWYLLGNPDNLHAMEVSFLNGRQVPYIESTDVDFDNLGIQTRGYFDFGVSLSEYRAGFKSKGAA